jgi:hypothetical protein
MENNLTNKEAKTNELLLIDTVAEASREVSEEFTLPDYVPEVRRVLGVSAQAVPETKYVNTVNDGTVLECSGTVTYSVIYLNDEGTLCALPLSSAYEITIPLNSTPYITEVSAHAESPCVRVSAPRRLNIKSTIKNRAIAFKREECSAKITPNSSAEQIYLEKREKEISTLDLNQISREGLKISERLDNLSEGEKPIWCDASILLNEVKCQSNMVSVRGEVNIKCLLIRDGGENVISRTFPISEEIEANGTEAGEIARAYARCVSLSISNEQRGESNELFFDLTYDINGEIVKNRRVDVEIDGYSTGHESEASYKDLEYQSVASMGATSFTVSEGVKRKNKEIKEIITVLADPVYEKCEIKGKRICLAGSLHAVVIGKETNEQSSTTEYYSDEYVLPIKLEVDGAQEINKITPLCTLALGNLNARYDNEKFYINCEVVASYLLLNSHKQRVLDTLEIKTESKIKRNNAEVRVCFLNDKDELWDIAKRYHTTEEKLREQNDLIDDTLFNKKCLII